MDIQNDWFEITHTKGVSQVMNKSAGEYIVVNRNTLKFEVVSKYETKVQLSKNHKEYYVLCSFCLFHLLQIIPKFIFPTIQEPWKHLLLHVVAFRICSDTIIDVKVINFFHFIFCKFKIKDIRIFYYTVFCN